MPQSAHESAHAHGPEFIADHLPRVTVDDVRRFSDTVEIRDSTR